MTEVHDHLEVRWLGRVNYDEALIVQESLVAQHASGECGDTLLLLEHDPVYTIGRTRNQSSLGEIKRLPHPVVETNRGGQATYHGPGQLIGYPILDLKERGSDLHKYLRALELLLIGVLAEYGVAAQQRPELTGVWVGQRKIASIGVGIRSWITMHGFALNVCGDLSPFDAITPCGIAGVQMTSMSLETGRPVTVNQVATKIAGCFEEGCRHLSERQQCQHPPGLSALDSIRVVTL